MGTIPKNPVIKKGKLNGLPFFDIYVYIIQLLIHISSYMYKKVITFSL
jgi:hypothetical protein